MMELLGLIAVALQELVQYPDAYWTYIKRAVQEYDLNGDW